MATSNKLFISVSVCVGLLFAFNLRMPNPLLPNAYAAKARQMEAKSKFVTVDLFVMSQCPWGTRAENIARELMRRFGERLKIGLYYIVTVEAVERTQTEESASPAFKSLFGISEIEEDMRQLLIAELYPDKFWDYLISRNVDIRSPDWKSHALFSGIDPELIEEGMKSGEGISLLEANLKKQEERRRWETEGEEWSPPLASPTIYINGKLYRGNATLPSLAVAVNNAIGDKLFAISGIQECYSDGDCLRKGKIGKCVSVEAENTRPATATCRCEFTDQPQVKLTVINDPCYPVLLDKSPLIEHFMERYPGLIDSGVSSESEEGERLVEMLGIDFLPAYIFDQTIEAVENFDSLIESGMLDGDQGYYLVISNHRQEGTYLKRERIPETLDIFVMSHCPFSLGVVNQLIEAVREGIISKGVKAYVHYIATAKQLDSDEPGSPERTVFHSLHGAAEIEENMRQLCVQKYYPDNFANYLSLRNREIESTLWERAAMGASIDPEVVWRCVYREGKELLQDDLKKAKELKIEASPTFLWENQYLFLDSNKLQELPGLEGIDISLGGSCQ